MGTGFLAVNYRSGIVPRLVSYTGAIQSPFGATFGALDSGTGDSNMAFNRVITFYGLIDGNDSLFFAFYAVADNQVYQSFDNANTWTSVFTLTPFTGTTVKKSGLNIVYLNGQPAMCVFWFNPGDSHWYGAYSFNGRNWTTQDLGVQAFATASNVTSDTVYHNKVYASLSADGATSTHACMYDPGVGRFTLFSLPNTTTTGSGSICVYNNRVFCLYTVFISGSGLSHALVELTGSNVTTIASTISGVTGSVATGTCCTLFVDPNVDRLYAVFRDSVGFECWQFDSSLSSTDITTTVFPSGGSALNPAATSARVLAMIDGADVPGTTIIYLFFSPSGATASSWLTYLWNGPTAAISVPPGNIATGSASHAMPFNRYVTGTYFWVLGIPNPVVISRTYAGTGIRLVLRLYGASNAFRAFFALNNEEYPTRVCTLSNPNSGTVVGGTLVRNMIGGTPSGTAFEVTWLAETDGVSEGDSFKLICQNLLI